MRIHDIHPPESLPMALEEFQAQFRGEEGTNTPKTLDFENPVPRTCWIKTYGFPLKEEKGEVTRVVFWTEDITDVKRAEENVRRYQERLRALASDLIIARSKNDNV
jgi:PAS domain-containing protein